MYKRILILYLIFYWALTAESQENKTSYFEGEIHYKISSESLNEGIPVSSIITYSGDTMIGKVKHNKYIQYQNTGGELGSTKIIFLLEEGIGYMDFEKSDTIIQFSIEQNQDSLLSLKLNPNDTKVILNDTCQSVTMKYVPHYRVGKFEYVESKYYFNPGYRLDKNMYANHKRSFWNRYVELTESISVEIESTNFPFYKNTYKAVKIIEKEIPDEEFKIDPSKIIKINNDF